MNLRSLLLVSTLAISGLALAQNDNAVPAPTPSPNTPAVAARAHNKLGLTDQQRQQMRSIKQSARDKAAVIKHDSSLNEAQKEEKLKSLRAETREQMKGVLTPDQQQKMEQFKANRKARVQEQLGLTADQQSKMKDTLAKAKQERQAVLNDQSLSQDQKLAQLKQIRENTHAQMSQILTPEQMQKMKQMRQMRRGHRRGGVGPMGM